MGDTSYERAADTHVRNRAARPRHPRHWRPEPGHCAGGEFDVSARGGEANEDHTDDMHGRNVVGEEWSLGWEEGDDE